MKKLTKYMSLALSVLVLASCGGGTPEGELIPEEGHIYSQYFAGERAKNTYKALIPETINKELNYLVYNDGARAKHWANFEDGLLLQNKYGVLEKQLASKATEQGQKVFTFDVREGAPWVRYDGEIYEANIDGEKVKQYVSARDFLTSAKYVLDYANKSQLVYLYANFIEGAAEYYQYTYCMYQSFEDDSWLEIVEDKQAFAQRINELVLKQTGRESQVTADDIDAISRFERVGVRVTKEPGSNGGGTIQYTLMNPAFYFPTLLAYSCYLPVNEYFIDEVSTLFGKKNDKMLYCGPFIWHKSSDTKVIYKKNEKYWNASRVLIDTLEYTKINLNDESSAIRAKFERGDIDAFGLSIEDSEGWEKYITGPDGTGTIENPYDPYVNSREVDYIDYVYGLQINVNRVGTAKGNQSGKSYAVANAEKDAEGGLEHIANAQKALLIDEVRELVIAAFDMPIYNQRYSNSGKTADQYQINTYVPKGFVQDQNALDYTQTHYYKAYADWYEKENGVRLPITSSKEGEVSVDSLIKQGQHSGTYIPHNAKNPETGRPEPFEEGRAKLDDLRKDALAAIEAYNNEYPESAIQLPVQMEMFSLWGDPQAKKYDGELMRAMNQRLNGQYDEVTFNRTTAESFLVIPTYDINITNHDVASNGGNWDLGSVWGWGPDYGDPMSYLNTYHKHGDWSNILGFVNEDYTPSYHLTENGKIEEYDLLDAYSQLVTAADQEYKDINKRYAMFAQAECMLINELHIFKPLTMHGQGRSVSVSRAAGYEAPQGSYGLAKDRNDGIVVLTDAITREKRQECQGKFEKEKKEYVQNHDPINIYDR